jgi:hypothetical protein
MKASNKALLLAIAEKIKKRGTLTRPPLLVFVGATELPATSEAEIEAARIAGRSIMRIHFVKPIWAANSDSDVTKN